jgi:type III pantothenate kinase
VNLLIDMGNSRLKWAVSEAGQLSIGKAIQNERLNHHTLLKLWQELTPPKRVVVASVAANQHQDTVLEVAQSLWTDIEITQVRSQAQGFGVTNAYLQPKKLGVDRWLALIAAKQLYHAPVCIVDCGTAITIDLLDKDGCHLGGFISAGLTLMKKSLVSGTNALYSDNSTYPLIPAKATEAAIYGGTLYAALGLISQISANYPDSLLILTGGDAELIAEHLNCQAIIRPNLVLRGLAVIAETEQ